MGPKNSRQKTNPNYTGRRINQVLRVRKNGKKKSQEPQISDIRELSIRCGLREEVIRDLQDKVLEKNPAGKLSKTEFIELYCSLRTESFDKLIKISEFIFKSFDRDNNGIIDCEEFIVS